MAQTEIIKLFTDAKIRVVWDDEKEKYYFSVVDCMQVLTEQPDTAHARNYWKVLKHRLAEEGNESVTNCNQLKLTAADGKRYLTDVADAEQLFRIIRRKSPTGCGNFSYGHFATGCGRIFQHTLDAPSLYHGFH